MQVRWIKSNNNISLEQYIPQIAEKERVRCLHVRLVSDIS